MATSTRSFSHAGELSSPTIQSCPVSRDMLLAAFNDKLAIALRVVWRAVIGAMVFWLLGSGLPVQPGLEFYAALSATIGVLYLANLADVKGIRDAITSVVPALLVWGILLFDVHNAGLVGLTLFTHLLLSFFAGFARVSGSLRDLALWPVLFGGMSVTLAAFVEQFLI